MTDLRKAVEELLYAYDKDWLPVGLPNHMQALRQALSNEFNPDWNQVEALQESLREHMAEIQRLRQALAQPKQRMNERIQELAEQAGFENGHQDRNGNSLSYELEKFARLIIEEANDVVYGLLEENTGAEVVVRVKEHFGVE